MGINARTTMLVGSAASADRGHFRYDSATDKVILYWPRSGDTGSFEAIDARVTAVANGIGRVLDTNSLVNSTSHPLGGANMGPVCDLDGRVHGQRGLYVLDGALIPGTTAGCAPSMTIAAIAERGIDNITAADLGTVI